MLLFSYNFRLYKGLVPLWSRQIPYTMMKFACFERTVEALYKYVVPKPRADCSKAEQLVVTFCAGYIAGVFCAIVSHPADTIVSKLNQKPGSNFIEVGRDLGFAGNTENIKTSDNYYLQRGLFFFFLHSPPKVFWQIFFIPCPTRPVLMKPRCKAMTFHLERSFTMLSHNGHY